MDVYIDHRVSLDGRLHVAWMGKFCVRPRRAQQYLQNGSGVDVSLKDSHDVETTIAAGVDSDFYLPPLVGCCTDGHTQVDDNKSSRRRTRCLQRTRRLEISTHGHTNIQQ